MSFWGVFTTVTVTVILLKINGGGSNNSITRRQVTVVVEFKLEPSTGNLNSTTDVDILYMICTVINNNNNNDRLTAFDPGQPG